MKALGVVVGLILGALALFSLLNWSALSAPSALSLGLATVRAPLGLVLLGGAALLTAAFVALVLFQRTAALLEVRRFARELRAQRELADKAEASRFVELRTFLEAELRRASDGAAAARAELDGKLGRLEQGLVAKLAELENGISAHVAEVEDKLGRVVQ